MEAVGQLTGGVRPRLQQPADHHPLVGRPPAPARSRRGAPAPLRRRDLRHGRPGRQADRPAPRLRPAPGAQARGVRRRRSALRGVADMLDTRHRARASGSSTELPAEPCIVEADVSQFETALVNMAVNARDAMDGEGTLTLRGRRAAARLPPIRGHAGAPATVRGGVAHRYRHRASRADSWPTSSSRSSPPRRSARAPGSA